MPHEQNALFRNPYVSGSLRCCDYSLLPFRPSCPPTITIYTELIIPFFSTRSVIVAP